ncbi:hypothetical protein [Methylorubrum extorquens]|jgi:hypothetical protein|uniref:hypothetical protein n=1 Tax=Methylorubrum extorquens TaxID=408 RepID=UPI0022379C84|nr:hypothetical protein [Methylorubrum extorquens]UYW30355.1 hypothetical protein OKB92_15220 [Methylorubrum extorquens]
MIDEWDVIHAAILRLRARAGDAQETASDVEEWQADVRARLETILLDAGHPDQDRLDRALQAVLTVGYPAARR